MVVMGRKFSSRNQNNQNDSETRSTAAERLCPPATNLSTYSARENIVDRNEREVIARNADTLLRMIRSIKSEYRGLPQ